MKTIRNLFLATLALFSVPAFALDLNVVANLNGGTSNIVASTTNTYSGVASSVVSCAYSTDVAVQVTYKLVGAGTSNVTLNWDWSLDGSNWQTGAFATVLAASGTTTVSKAASQALGSIGYIRLGSIINANATDVTNLVVKAANKRGL